MILSKSKIYEPRLIVFKINREKVEMSIVHKNFKILHLFISQNNLRQPLFPFLEKSVFEKKISLIIYFLHLGAIPTYILCTKINRDSVGKYLHKKSYEWYAKMLMFD